MIVISREKIIGVDDMRDIVAMTGLRSAPGQERVVIIDHADNMKREGANAGLKMFEEPGEHLRFILISDIPAALLPTIRSRSYRIRFSLLGPESLMEFARAIGDNPDDPETLDAMSFAAGRPGWYLRFRHSEAYRDIVRDISSWAATFPPLPKSVDAALKWKQVYREKADNLAQQENRSAFRKAATRTKSPDGFSNPPNSR